MAGCWGIWGFRMCPWSLEHHPNSSFPPGRGRRRDSAARQRRSREPGRTVPLPMAARPPRNASQTGHPGPTRDPPQPEPTRLPPPGLTCRCLSPHQPSVPRVRHGHTPRCRDHHRWVDLGVLGLLWAVPSSCSHSVAGDEPLSRHPSPHCPRAASTSPLSPLHPTPAVPRAARPGRAWPGDGSRTLPADSAAMRGEQGRAGARILECHPAGDPSIPTRVALGTDQAGGTSPKSGGERVG